ncbi:MAG: sensor domain-containing diguanylate cyclase, partial [Pseudomonadota bacterium]|nr:sensor domain-containing diguanylate cyclase [Pseudomonadota bacterium]
MPESFDQGSMQQVRRHARNVSLAAGFAVAYAVASLYGDHFTGPSHLALYWPASGLAFAVVVMGGLRWALLIPVAFALQALWSPNTPAFLAMSAASNVIALSVGGWLARRDTALRPGTVRYAVWMMFAGLVTSAVGGALGGYTLWLNGMAPDGMPGAQVLWALGDFLGIASVAPALMIASARWQRGMLRSDPARLLGERTLWNLALVASFLVMAWGMDASHQFALGLTALPLAVMVWSAVSFTPLRTAMSALLTVAFVAALASQAVSGFPQPGSVPETAILIGYLCLLAMLPQGLALSIDEHRWLNRRLERRATTDALSGLPNRAAFERAAQELLEEPTGPPLALAYLDLDNLKLVNDTAGHRAGDAVIVAVARALAATVDKDDLLAHLGADEFMVLMRNATPQVARERA